MGERCGMGGGGIEAIFTSPAGYVMYFGFLVLPVCCWYSRLGKRIYMCCCEPAAKEPPPMDEADIVEAMGLDPRLVQHKREHNMDHIHETPGRPMGRSDFAVAKKKREKKKHHVQAVMPMNGDGETANAKMVRARQREVMEMKKGRMDKQKRLMNEVEKSWRIQDLEHLDFHAPR